MKKTMSLALAVMSFSATAANLPAMPLTYEDLVYVGNIATNAEVTAIQHAMYQCGDDYKCMQMEQGRGYSTFFNKAGYSMTKTAIEYYSWRYENQDGFSNELIGLVNMFDKQFSPFLSCTRNDECKNWLITQGDATQTELTQLKTILSKFS